MVQLIRKIRNYQITEVAQIYKITFWLTVVSVLIVLAVILLDEFWIK